MRWPWSKAEQPANRTLSVSDPALAELFAPGVLASIGGIQVSETNAMGLSAFYRAVSLITGTLASLPLNTWTDSSERKRVASIFDNPDGDEGQTPYEWKETAFTHLIMHGRCGALKIRNEAGGLARLQLVHPLAWSIRLPSADEISLGILPVGGLWFDVQLASGGRETYDATDFWYVPSLSLNGVQGVSLLTYARLSMATAIAGDKSAGNMFNNGALISGIVTPDEDQDITEDIPEMRRQLNMSVLGHENAGTIAIMNRRLKFTPWTMSAVDAQFLQSRQFSIEEIARWTGVPPHLLMQTDKQTSWGTGVDEQNRGLSKFVLGHWACRFEQRASRLLANPRWVEFDFAALERPNFAVEVDLLMRQTGGKPILTVNEARAVRNLPPVDGGDVLVPPAPPALTGGPDAAAN